MPKDPAVKRMARRDVSILIQHLYKIPKIRYASISDEMGRRIVGGMKPGVISATEPNDEVRLALHSIVSLKTAESYEKYTGKVEYLCISWEKMFAVFFLLKGSRCMALTFEKSADQKSVIRRALRLIKEVE